MATLPTDWWLVASVLSVLRFVYTTLTSPDDALSQLKELSENPEWLDNPLIRLLNNYLNPFPEALIKVLKSILVYYVRLWHIAGQLVADVRWLGVGLLGFVLFSALVNYRVLILLPRVAYPPQLEAAFSVVVVLLLGSLAAGTRRALDERTLVPYGAVIGVVVLSLPMLAYVAHPLLYLLLGGLTFTGMLLFQELTNGRYSNYLFGFDFFLVLATGAFALDYIRRAFLATDNVFLVPLGGVIVAALGLLFFTTKHEVTKWRTRRRW